MYRLIPQEEGRDGKKAKAQNGTQTASYCNNTLRRTAPYKSRGAHELGKLLTSIASRLTLPKLHLATLNRKKLDRFTA